MSESLNFGQTFKKCLSRKCHRALFSLPKPISPTPEVPQMQGYQPDRCTRTPPGLAALGSKGKAGTTMGNPHLQACVPPRFLISHALKFLLG